MKYLSALLGIITAPLIFACGSTPHKVEKETLASNWSGEPYKNLLVMGVYEDRANRISSEITLSDQLNSRGAKASVMKYSLS